MQSLTARQLTPNEHRHQHNAHAPHVDRLGFVASTTSEFWGDIWHTPTSAREKASPALVLVDRAQAKVGQLEVAVGGEKEVLGLKVAVCDSF